jgi:hypothetical protein
MVEGGSTRQDKTYIVTVMVLMVVILVTLAALWMMERKARRQAQADLVAARQENGRLKGMLAQMAMAQGMDQGMKVSREDLPTQTVQWDGRPRSVMVLSARTGARFGFMPGDAVVIAAPRASEPATTSREAPTEAVAEPSAPARAP